MTLTDYINQENPKRLPSGSVILESIEYDLSNLYGQNHVSVRIGKEHLQYVTMVGGHQLEDELRTLFTTDEDGNPVSRSVFSIRTKDTKKRYYEIGKVGKAKYTVSSYDGVQKHNDGSNFYGIATFKNKVKLAEHIKELEELNYKIR